MIEITSATNPKIKELVKLQKKKERDLKQLFLVEGFHLVDEALKRNIVDCIVTTSQNYFKYCNQGEVIVVPSYIMEKITTTKSNQEIVAVCRYLTPKTARNENVLLLDDIQDPGNLGTIIRSALAFNIDTLYLSKNCVDIYNEKVLRSTQGAVFALNIIRVDSLVDQIKLLQQAGLTVFGTALENGVDITTITKPTNYGLVVGNEGNGVSKEVLKQCNQNLYIPIHEAESLNVAVAASIGMFYLNLK